MEQSLPSTSSFRLPNPSSSCYDVGFRFVPTDVELLHCLRTKIVSPNYDNHLIMTTDIYKHEPWFLPWDPVDNVIFHGDERYFFVQRKPFSGKDTGTRPKRTIDSEQGWWNSNTDDKPIYDEGGKVLGYVKSLTFFLKDETKKRKAGDSKNRKECGIKTDWIMHEYMLELNKVRQWVLCRIHYNGKTSLSFSSSPQTPSRCSGGPDPLQPPPQASHCSGGPVPMQLPTRTSQCSGGPNPMQPPSQALHCSGRPDPLQPPASKRVKSSRPKDQDPQESQLLEVQQESQQQQEENYEPVLAGVDGDAEEDIGSWIDSLIFDIVED
ncbi:hypothetical protein SLEP1_g25099 [Rubroshorea leprosula]|uniref:NAC domain-containing protein n=1 Tax=Rubroshorea leprosula TaxID=152421 RepID=A0AAV5JN63_9ROSI|nr:hypothetical protein SLEP1_g25099 [Rubroshorea leprosula]